MSNNLGAAGAVVKIGSSQKSNHQIKLSLSKSLIHTVCNSIISQPRFSDMKYVLLSTNLKGDLQTPYFLLLSYDSSVN